FEHAFGEDQSILLRLRAQDLENQLLLAHAARAGDVEFLGDLRQVGNIAFLEFSQTDAHFRSFLFLLPMWHVHFLSAGFDPAGPPQRPAGRAAALPAPARGTPGSPHRPFAADTDRHLLVSSGKPAVRLNRKSRRAE